MAELMENEGGAKPGRDVITLRRPLAGHWNRSLGRVIRRNQLYLDDVLL